MATINFVTGEKGGVGKSIFCRALYEYYQVNGIAFKFFDADRTNPDVGVIYEPQNYAGLKNKKEPAPLNNNGNGNGQGDSGSESKDGATKPTGAGVTGLADTEEIFQGSADPNYGAKQPPKGAVLNPEVSESSSTPVDSNPGFQQIYFSENLTPLGNSKFKIQNSK